MFLKIYSIIFFILKFSIVNLSSLDDHCFFINFKKLLLCDQFDRLEQLDFRNTTIEYNGVVIQPNSNLNLEFNSSLNFEGLKLGIDSYIELGNFVKYDPYFNPFKSIEFSNSNRRFSLKIFDSNLLFDDLECQINDENLKKTYFLSNLNIDFLRFENILFNSELCPLMFYNTSVKNWIFSTQNPVKYSNLNYTKEILNIKVNKLLVDFGLDRFVTIVNTENLLNEFIFESLNEIEFDTSYIETIDGESLSKFSNLTRIKLLGYDYKPFLENGIEWMSYVNNSTLFDIVFDLDFFPYDDNDICIFKTFPFDKNIVPLFFSRYSSIDFYLPCSCTIYYLFKNYDEYSSLVENNIRYENLFPYHCFKNQILINEQINLCNIEYPIENCDLNVTKTTQEAIVINQNFSCFQNPDQNGALCTCNIGQLNILECTNSSILNQPDDFSSQYNWDYVSFKGSSIDKITKFKNLNLKLNATLHVSNIQMFSDDLLSNISTKFRFIIESSNITNNILSFSFNNFSNIEFKNCFFNSNLSIKMFEGSSIDTLIINGIDSNSNIPSITIENVTNEINVKLFKMINLYSNQIELDSNLLNEIFFKKTSQIDLINTRLGSIESKSLSKLVNLRIIRLDNVNIDKVIESYFESLPNYVVNGEINLENDEINWIWNKKLEKVYFGNNNLRNVLINNDTICFYAGLNNSTKVYFYENLNTQNGLPCSCTMYWIYRAVNFSDLYTDPDLKYIPKCIQNLNNTINMNQKIDQCFSTFGTPVDTCKSLKTELSTSAENTSQFTISIGNSTEIFFNHSISENLTTVFISDSSTAPVVIGNLTSETFATQQTTDYSTSTSKSNSEVDKLKRTVTYLAIALSVIGVLFLISIVYIFHIKKKSKFQVMNSKIEMENF